MNPATILQARQKASNTVNASATAEGIEYVNASLLQKESNTVNASDTAEGIEYRECQRTAERIE